jgi:hypothetical protein
MGIYQASGYINKGSCHCSNSHQHAVDACNNKGSCSLSPTSAEFGSDPCGGTDKEFFVTYTCVTFDAPTQAAAPAQIQTEYDGVRMALFNEGAAAVLTCPNEQVIGVLDASYGAKQGFYISNGYIGRGSCHASNSATVVSDACQGKGTCEVAASQQTFSGADCAADAKRQLKITYRCSKAPVVFAQAVAKPAPRKYEFVARKVERVVPQPAKLAEKDVAPAVRVNEKGQTVNAKGEVVTAENVVKIGNSEIHVHVTQLSAPEPNAEALNHVESHLDQLHETAMTKIEGLLDDIETHRKEKKPCLKKLQLTINKFKEAFVKEAQNVERITHKYSYADDAPTLV